MRFHSNMIVSILCLASIVMGAYDEAKYYSTQPPPRILSHKQAQNHDGGFKFHFASENGLAQTEFIAPDGSRNGGYSYVDPHGKTISVKYTAGKEGFRILEGGHIPREPHLQKLPQRAPANPPDVDSYKPQPYELPYQDVKPIQPQYQPQFKPQYIPQPSAPQYVQKQAQYTPTNYPAVRRNYEEAPDSNNVDDAEDPKEPEYNDEPGKPYSFGTGYAFHIAS